MNATNTGLVFVDHDGHKMPCGCGCYGPTAVYRTVWDRLCQQLFGAMPPGIDSGDQLPDIEIWKDGVALTDDSYPFTFTVTSYDDSVPKKDDVIEYKGRYYIIGEVQ